MTTSREYSWGWIARSSHEAAAGSLLVLDIWRVPETGALHLEEKLQGGPAAARAGRSSPAAPAAGGWRPGDGRAWRSGMPASRRRGTILAQLRLGARALAVVSRRDGSILFLHLLLWTGVFFCNFHIIETHPKARCMCPKVLDVLLHFYFNIVLALS